MVLTMLGAKIDLEKNTAQGRIDAVIELTKHIYITEFKYTGSEAGASETDRKHKMDSLLDSAIQQIRVSHYADAYLNSNKKTMLLGVGFVDKEIGVRLVVG